MVKSNAAKRNARLDKSFSNNEGGGEDWSRPYVSRDNPGQRFMITITKKEQYECPGIDLVEFTYTK
jgi:hypothetical protein